MLLPDPRKTSASVIAEMASVSGRRSESTLSRSITTGVSSWPRSTTRSHVPVDEVIQVAPQDLEAERRGPVKHVEHDLTVDESASAQWHQLSDRLTTLLTTKRCPAR